MSDLSKRKKVYVCAYSYFLFRKQLNRECARVVLRKKKPEVERWADFTGTATSIIPKGCCLSAYWKKKARN